MCVLYYMIDKKKTELVIVSAISVDILADEMRRIYESRQKG